MYAECLSTLGGSCERRGKNRTWQDSGCAVGGSTLDRPQEWARTTCGDPGGRLYPSVTPIGSPRAGQPKEDGGMVWGWQCVARRRLWLGVCRLWDGEAGGHVPSWAEGPSLGSLALSSSEIMSSPPPQSRKVCLEREHCKDYRYSPSQAECRRASSAGPGPRANKDKSTQAETRGERAMHAVFIDTTRVTSCMTRYKNWARGEVEVWSAFRTLSADADPPNRTK